MAKLVDLSLEPLSKEAFAPYGSVIAELPPNTPAVYGIKPAKSLDFVIDGSTRLLIVRYPFQAMEFHLLERHLFVTETRIPLMSVPTVMVVAPAPATSDAQEYPDPGSVRAFLLDGHQGVLLHRGIWHGLDCFPTVPPYADFVFVSEERTEDEWVQGVDPCSHKYSRTVDFLERCATKFRVVDRQNLTGNADSR